MQLSQLPTKIAVAFANGGAKNAIPVPSQIGIVAGAASYTDGFPPLTRTPLAAGGVPPSGADMNGVLYEMSAVERWLCAGGQFKYDAAFAATIGGYPKSSVLNSTNSDIQWISTADNNVTDPDSTSAAGWVSLAAYGIANVTGITGGSVTLTPAQYGKPIINLTGALTSNAIIILPANQPQVKILNNTTGGFTLTCKTAAGTGAVIAQGAIDTFFGDGTNLISVTLLIAGQLALLPSFGQNLSANGYKKLPGGIIMQWGQFVQNDNGTALPYSFALPVGFPNACLQASITPGNYNVSGGISATAEGLNNASINGFTFGSNNPRTYRIIAIGY